MLWHWSPSYQGAGSGATGHMAALEPTLAGRQDSVLHGKWWCMGACTAPCLDLKLVCKGTRSVGYRHTHHRVPHVCDSVLCAREPPRALIKPTRPGPIREPPPAPCAYASAQPFCKMTEHPRAPAQSFCKITKRSRTLWQRGMTEYCSKYGMAKHCSMRIG
jgi:hypothetical protein